MKYFKNIELAKLYHVSEKSVRNWIDSAEQGKLSLQLYKENGRAYIANTAKNTQVIEQLVEKGKKYKNTRGFKAVRPKQKFYELYNPKQVLDIISNLDIYREVPVQYTYFNSGAERWDTYTQRLLREAVPNALSNTVELLSLNLDYLDALIQEYDSVNIIDLGVGNALPVKGLLEHFANKGLLKRYIGIDISQELLDIAEHNINTWFGDKVRFEGYVRDIVYDRFDDLLVSETFGEGAGSTANIVLFLGGTLSNFREPSHALSTIHDSMGKNDLLFFTKKLDTQHARRYFELAAPGNQAIDLVLDLLNIDPSFYTVEQAFDETSMVRNVQAKLNVALSIEFELNGQKRALEINKGEGLLLWRARHQKAVDIIKQFDLNCFDLMLATASPDNSYLLTISKLKTGGL